MLSGYPPTHCWINIHKSRPMLIVLGFFYLVTFLHPKLTKKHCRPALEIGITRAGQVVVWGESGGPCLSRAFGVTEVTSSGEGERRVCANAIT